MSHSVDLRLDPSDEECHTVDDATNFNESMYANVLDVASGLGVWMRVGNRPHEGHSEVSACVYLPDGRVGFMFARPECHGNDRLAAAGAAFDVVEPFARVRMTYEGPLCVVSRRRGRGLRHGAAGRRDVAAPDPARRRPRDGSAASAGRRRGGLGGDPAHPLVRGDDAPTARADRPARPPRNLVVGGEGLVGVLDWELAHLGDPLEDVGWFCAPAWRHGRPRPNCWTPWPPSSTRPSSAAAGSGPSRPGSPPTSSASSNASCGSGPPSTLQPQRTARPSPVRRRTPRRSPSSSVGARSRRTILRCSPTSGATFAPGSP